MSVILKGIPYRGDTAGNNRKIREIARRWKQYFDWKAPDFFPWILLKFQCFPAETGRKSSGKTAKSFRPEYCFHAPATSRVFLRNMVTFPHLSGQFLQYPGTGTIDLGYFISSPNPLDFRWRYERVYHSAK